MRRLALLVCLAGCTRPAPPAVTRDFVDARGKTVAVPYPPRRIVSIVPGATELLFAAGAGGQVVGVTTYCDHPPEARTRAKIGDIVVDMERLMALQPDLVVTSWSVTRQTTAQIEARGFPVFAVDPTNLEEIARAIRTLGEVTGHEADASAAAAALLERVRSVKSVPGPTFYFEHSGDPIGTTGPESYAGDALRRAGGRNIFEGGWKMIDWEAVVARDPEIILIAHDQRERLKGRAGWAELRAVKAGRVHTVAKEHFVYPTPRLVEGLEEAARIFHAKGP